MIWDLASCVPAPPTSTCVAEDVRELPGHLRRAGRRLRRPDAELRKLPDGSGVRRRRRRQSVRRARRRALHAGDVRGLPDGDVRPAERRLRRPHRQLQQLPGRHRPAAAAVRRASAARPTAATCTPLTCAAYAGICGQQTDGCGGLTPDCNPCPAGQTCGGGGTPGDVRCAPRRRLRADHVRRPRWIICGPAGDGCGNVIMSCGTVHSAADAAAAAARPASAAAPTTAPR